MSAIKGSLDWFRDQGILLEKALMLGRQDVPSGTSPEEFFHGCGFVEVNSLDITDEEGADIIHDMNKLVPDSLLNNFDFIFDGGTMEHVFDTRMFLCNCVKMLRVGGIVHHGNPLNNWVNHGFYQFSPALYFAFYKANYFSIEQLSFVATAKIFKEGKRPKAFQQIVFESKDYSQIEKFALSPRIELPESITSNVMFSISFWARKEKNVDEIITPTQPIYSEEYGSEEYRDLKKIIKFKKGN